MTNSGKNTERKFKIRAMYCLLPQTRMETNIDYKKILAEKRLRGIKPDIFKAILRKPEVPGQHL